MSTSASSHGLRLGLKPPNLQPWVRVQPAQVGWNLAGGEARGATGNPTIDLVRPCTGRCQGRGVYIPREVLKPGLHGFCTYLSCNRSALNKDIKHGIVHACDAPPDVPCVRRLVAAPVIDAPPDVPSMNRPLPTLAPTSKFPPNVPRNPSLPQPTFPPCPGSVATASTLPMWSPASSDQLVHQDIQPDRTWHHHLHQGRYHRSTSITIFAIIATTSTLAIDYD